MSKKNSDKVIVFLSEGGYKLSSYYGKILHNGLTFSSLSAAKQACIDAGYDYHVA